MKKHTSNRYSTKRQLVTSILMTNHVREESHLLLLLTALPQRLLRRYGQRRQKHHALPKRRNPPKPHALLAAQYTTPPHHARINETLRHLFLLHHGRDERGSLSHLEGRREGNAQRAQVYASRPHSSPTHQIAAAVVLLLAPVEPRRHALRAERVEVEAWCVRLQWGHWG